jgi:hypothetical protein
MSSSERRLFKHLPPAPRRKILEYLQEQHFLRWVGIRDIVVSPGLSLYDVIDSIDRNWPGRYPSAILVARASKVVDQRALDLQALEM